MHATLLKRVVRGGGDVKASRPNWPRGQNFDLGLGLVTSGLGLGLGTLRP